MTRAVGNAHSLPFSADLADAAESYPDAHWPIQITQALQGLIHAASTACAEDLPAVPDEIAAPLVHTFPHGVILGLSRVPKVAGRKQSPCRDLLECLRDRHDDVLRFAFDLRIPPTSNQADYAEFGVMRCWRWKPCRAGISGLASAA
ncbi:MAG TPA: hypothetical protein VGA04_02275 [Streptosporangiaceae bacterium]